MTETEYKSVKALLGIKERLTPTERVFVFRLTKWKERDLTVKGRRYLFRLLSIYRKQVPDFHTLNLARLYEAHNDDVHVMFKVLQGVAEGTPARELAAQVWPQGEVYQKIKRKGSKVAVPYKFKASEYILSYLVKLCAKGMILNADGHWKLTTDGDSFLYAYEMGDHPDWLPDLTADAINDPKLFEPDPLG